jgi:polyhydroxyalkanoate synthase subunit PhaE
MTSAQWNELSARWRDLYNEQAKVAQQWLDTQTDLATKMAGTDRADGDPAVPGADPAALADLWRTGMASLSLGTVPPGLGVKGVGHETLGKMLDPISMSLMGGNQVGEAIKRLTEGPRLADAGSVERDMAQLMHLYVGVQTATREYESVVAGAWMEISQRFTYELAERFAADRKVMPAKDAHKLWLSIANETLTTTHRTTAYLEAQRKLLRAGMDFLLEERKVVEQLVAPAGLPTRTEIDELHHTVHTLKRQVRALEKAAAAGTTRSAGTRARAARKVPGGKEARQ